MDYQAVWLKIKELLKDTKKVVLCCHESVDDDALGSVVGMGLFVEHLNVQARFACYESIPDRISLVRRDFDLAGFVQRSQDIHGIGALIVLDTGEIKRLGKGQDLFYYMQAQGVPVLNFDHHRDNKLYGDLNIIDPEASATCEMLFCLLRNADITISEDMAHAMLWGILADTNMLRTPNVTTSTRPQKF